jgi:hypothetical protein
MSVAIQDTATREALDSLRRIVRKLDARVNRVFTSGEESLTTQLTTITHTEPGTADYAVQDLTTSTPYGFVSQDEGNTVLKVIANLQTRVQELETKLSAIDLLS